MESCNLITSGWICHAQKDILFVERSGNGMFPLGSYKLLPYAIDCTTKV